MVDHQEVVADRIEQIDVAPRQIGGGVGDRRHFLVEHVEAQLLGAADFRRGAGEPHFKRAEPAENRRPRRRRDHPKAAVGLEGREEIYGETERRVQWAGRPAGAHGAGKHRDSPVARWFAL